LLKPPSTAVKHHRADQLRQAEQLYRPILQIDPRQVDALNPLGPICFQVGGNDLAIHYINQALRPPPAPPAGG
jgi:hypothetical protein